MRDIGTHGWEVFLPIEVRTKPTRVRSQGRPKSDDKKRKGMSK